jgi:hypothetical protein
MKDEKKDFWLTVSYKDTLAEFKLDSTIRGIAGRPELGRAWHGNTKLRSMTFVFDGDEKTTAKRALKRLKDQKLKAVLEGVL